VAASRSPTCEPGEIIDSVHFPLDGVVSLVTPLADGNIVAVATIGNEGIVGAPVMLGRSLAVRAISQVSGRALRMDARVFIEEIERLSGLRRIEQIYIQALFGQIAPGRSVQPPALQ
jgi:CRP-like cAMP-binding protein